jgi:glycosyltransferase involved in cell wall biosynthesis
MLKHTFVIPAYKESPYLEACIQSLLKQIVKSEILITTSTPSQFLEDLAKNYQLPYVINQNGNTSIANDWNFALSQPKTQYVTIAHQDDVYEENYTQEFLFKLEKHPNTLIAFSDYSDMINGEIMDRSLNKFVKHSLLLPFIFKASYQSQFVKKLILSFGSSICCPTVTYNKDLLKGFYFSNEYVVALDWFAWIEIAKKEGRFLYINKDLVKHRIHLESETTAQLSNGKRTLEEQNILKQIWGDFLGSIISKVYTLGYKGNQV